MFTRCRVFFVYRCHTSFLHHPVPNNCKPKKTALYNIYTPSPSSYELPVTHRLRAQKLQDMSKRSSDVSLSALSPAPPVKKTAPVLSAQCDSIPGLKGDAESGHCDSTLSEFSMEKPATKISEEVSTSQGLSECQVQQAPFQVPALPGTLTGISAAGDQASQTAKDWEPSIGETKTQAADTRGTLAPISRLSALSPKGPTAVEGPQCNIQETKMHAKSTEVAQNLETQSATKPPLGTKVPGFALQPLSSHQPNFSHSAAPPSVVSGPAVQMSKGNEQMQGQNSQSSASCSEMGDGKRLGADSSIWTEQRKDSLQSSADCRDGTVSKPHETKRSKTTKTAPGIGGSTTKSGHSKLTGLSEVVKTTTRGSTVLKDRKDKGESKSASTQERNQKTATSDRDKSKAGGLRTNARGLQEAKVKSAAGKVGGTTSADRSSASEIQKGTSQSCLGGSGSGNAATAEKGSSKSSGTHSRIQVCAAALTGHMPGESCSTDLGPRTSGTSQSYPLPAASVRRNRRVNSARVSRRAGSAKTSETQKEVSDTRTIAAAGQNESESKCSSEETGTVKSGTGDSKSTKATASSRASQRQVKTAQADGSSRTTKASTAGTDTLKSTADTDQTKQKSVPHAEVKAKTDVSNTKTSQQKGVPKSNVKKAVKMQAGSSQSAKTSRHPVQNTSAKSGTAEKQSEATVETKQRQLKAAVKTRQPSKTQPTQPKAAGVQSKGKTILPACVLNKVVSVVKENVRTISTEVITLNSASKGPSGTSASAATAEDENGKKENGTEACDKNDSMETLDAKDGLKPAENKGGSETADADRNLEGILPLDIEETSVPTSRSDERSQRKKKKKKKASKSNKEAQLEAERKELLGVLPQYIPENDSRLKKRKEDKVYNLSALFSGNFGEKQAEQRKRPNYFVAIQITNQVIKDGLKEVLAAVETGNKKVKPAFIPLDTLHLTMAVMHLGDEAAIEKAKTALDQCGHHHRISSDDGDAAESSVFEVTGLGDFRGQVVFAKVKEGAALDKLTKIAETIQTCLAEQEINTEDKSGFTPHITIMKMSKNPKLLKKGGVKKIAESLYKDSLTREFGSQTIATIQLCAMLKPKHAGYYHIEHEVSVIATNEPPTGGKASEESPSSGKERQVPLIIEGSAPDILKEKGFCRIPVEHEVTIKVEHESSTDEKTCSFGGKDAEASFPSNDEVFSSDHTSFSKPTEHEVETKVEHKVSTDERILPFKVKGTSAFVPSSDDVFSSGILPSRPDEEILQSAESVPITVEAEMVLALSKTGFCHIPVEHEMPVPVVHESAMERKNLESQDTCVEMMEDGTCSLKGDCFLNIPVEHEATSMSHVQHEVVEKCDGMTVSGDTGDKDLSIAREEEVVLEMA